jgi:hypothetical protein
MKRTKYERPTMDVVEVKQQPQLLAGSAKSGQMNDPSDYPDGGDPLGF